MSGFIAGGTATVLIIDNDGFWPDIEGEGAKAVLRLDSSVPDARLESALLNAMQSVNRELRAVKKGHLAAGYNTVADVPADRLGGTSELILSYRRAVYCTAGAELQERYRGYDTTSNGDQKAEALCPTIDDLKRDARHAIRDLLGIGHCTVELI